MWGTTPGSRVLGNGTLWYAWLPRSLHKPVQLPQLDPEDNSKQLIIHHHLLITSCLCAFEASSIRHPHSPQHTRVLLSPPSSHLRLQLLASSFRPRLLGPRLLPQTQAPRPQLPPSDLISLPLFQAPPSFPGSWLWNPSHSLLSQFETH